MDVEKLPEGLTATGAKGALDDCSCLVNSRPASCRDLCGIEILDQLLGSSSLGSQAADQLLDLRHLLREQKHAEIALRTFCDLRRQFEAAEYLRFYRLRRWLENHIRAVIEPGGHKAEVTVPLRLNGHCVEAIRRICLCAALNGGVRLVKPVLSFHFAADARTKQAGPALL